MLIQSAALQNFYLKILILPPPVCFSFLSTPKDYSRESYVNIFQHSVCFLLFYCEPVCSVTICWFNLLISFFFKHKTCYVYVYKRNSEFFMAASSIFRFYNLSFLPGSNRSNLDVENSMSYPRKTHWKFKKATFDASVVEGRCATIRSLVSPLRSHELESKSSIPHRMYEIRRPIKLSKQSPFCTWLLIPSWIASNLKPIRTFPGNFTLWF